MKTIIKNLFGILLLATLMASCTKDWLFIHGEGEIVTEKLELESIVGFDLHGKARIYVSQGDQQDIEVRAHENILRKLKTQVYDKVWEIKLERGNYRDYVLDVFITIPKLEEVHMSGDGEIDIENFTDQEYLNMNISGKGEVDFHEFSGLKEIKTYVSGTVEFDFHEFITGVEYQSIESSGVIDYDGFSLEAKVTEVDMSGTGTISVKTMERLNVHISGLGNVYFKGSPVITSNLSGAGKLIDAN